MKTLKRKFYKVVFETMDGTLTSCTVKGHRISTLSRYDIIPSATALIPNQELEMWVTYKPGRFVSAPPEFAKVGLHLMVFRSIREARKFAPLRPIWRCSVKGTTTKIPRLSVVGTAPEGTVMAKSVRLDERIQ